MFVDILHAFGVTGLKIKKNWSLHASIRGSFWHGVRGMDYLFIWTTIIKMAIILPTGQSYAPSAVIDDAWYCMVLHCIE